MAKFLIEYDTIEGVLIVKLDNNIISNVINIGINSSLDTDYSSITVQTLEVEGDIQKIITYTENEQNDVVGCIRRDDLPGFVGVPDKSKIQKDIEKYFGVK